MIEPMSYEEFCRKLKKLRSELGIDLKGIMWGGEYYTSSGEFDPATQELIDAWWDKNLSGGRNDGEEDVEAMIRFLVHDTFRGKP